jgi:hypothetical protein
VHTLRTALAASVILAALAAEAPNNVLTKQERREGFVLLFNGKDLSGWDGDPQIWSVRDGAIVGSTDTHSVDQNTFLIYKEPYADFVLKFDIKLRNHNSGVQFRSTRLPNWVVAGYQADASEAGDKSGWGNLYDERGKGRGLMRTPDEGWQKAKAVVHAGDWNHYEVVAQGRRVILRLNGVETLNQEVEKTDSGVIAIQAHRGPPMEVQLRNIKLKVLK